MRALKSYGLTAVLLLIIAAWFSTGIVVQGGNGPTASEFTVVSTVEPDGGPLTDAVMASGIALAVEHEEGINDPALSIAERNDLSAQAAGEQRTVRIENFDIQPMQMQVTLRGHTRAKATVNAVAQTSDIVRSVEVTEGQVVAEGDLICTLDSGNRQASIDQAQAAVNQAQATVLKAQLDFDTNEALRAKGLASENSAETFSANLSAAEAGLEAAQVALRNQRDELENTVIHAERAGIIQRPIVEVGTLLSFGGSCATIVQLDPMVFVGAIPQSKINYVKTGMPAEIKTITDQTATGDIQYIAVAADPATRSFGVEIEFPNPGNRIFDGLTAEARVDMGSIPAHLLPQSVLTLDSHGVLGVQTVKDSRVVFYPIQILGDARDGVWVSGLPASVDVITVGQEYVSDGQIVDARYAE